MADDDDANDNDDDSCLVLCLEAAADRHRDDSIRSDDAIVFCSVERYFY